VPIFFFSLNNPFSLPAGSGGQVSQCPSSSLQWVPYAPVALFFLSRFGLSSGTDFGVCKGLYFFILSRDLCADEFLPLGQPKKPSYGAVFSVFFLLIVLRGRDLFASPWYNCYDGSFLRRHPSFLFSWSVAFFFLFRACPRNIGKGVSCFSVSSACWEFLPEQTTPFPQQGPTPVPLRESYYGSLFSFLGNAMIALFFFFEKPLTSLFFTSAFSRFLPFSPHRPSSSGLRDLYLPLRESPSFMFPRGALVSSFERKFLFSSALRTEEFLLSPFPFQKLVAFFFYFRSLVLFHPLRFSLWSKRTGTLCPDHSRCSVNPFCWEADGDHSGPSILNFFFLAIFFATPRAKTPPPLFFLFPWGRSGIGVLALVPRWTFCVARHSAPPLSESGRVPALSIGRWDQVFWLLLVNGKDAVISYENRVLSLFLFIFFPSRFSINSCFTAGTGAR